MEPAVEVALASYLEAHALVSPLVGSRVYPEVLPQRPTYPAIVYQRVTTARVRSFDGPSGLARPRIQLDCYGSTYAQAKAVAAAVRLALDHKTFDAGLVHVQGAFLEDERDVRESEGRDVDDERRVSMDFFVWHEEVKE
jgi:hypothetical protein